MATKAKDLFFTKDFESAWDTFIGLVPLRRLSIGTRKILLDYLMSANGDLENFTDDYFWDVSNFFDFLDALEEMVEQDCRLPRNSATRIRVTN